MTAWTASASCERAVLDLNTALAEAQETIRNSMVATPRRTARRRGYSSLNRSSALALASMVSTCEDYCQAALTALVEHGLKPANATGELLWDHVVESTFTSWNAHLQLWRRWGVEVLKSPEYKALAGFIAVRNSAVHGLGEMTRVQQRSAQAKKDIASTGLKVAGNRVIIDEAALRSCRTVCADFMRYLDRQLLALMAP